MKTHRDPILNVSKNRGWRLPLVSCFPGVRLADNKLPKALVRLQVPSVQIAEVERSNRLAAYRGGPRFEIRRTSLHLRELLLGGRKFSEDVHDHLVGHSLRSLGRQQTGLHESF